MLNREENYGYINKVMKRFWEHNKGSIEDHGVIQDTFKYKSIYIKYIIYSIY